ncbi:hypothetical protein SNN51_001087 [Cronobacter turicensis]|nr:hypothetical protein [Cronobacter turicensis]
MKKIFLLFILMSSPVWASKYPVITSITVAKDTSTNTYYKITQSVMEIGSAADTHALPAGNYVAGLGITYYHPYQGGTVVSMIPGYVTQDPKNGWGSETIGEMALRAYDQEKNVTQIASAYYQPDDRDKFPNCIGYFGGLLDGSLIHHEQVVDPAGCLTVPPSDEWCKITTPQIILDHGSLTLKDSEGDTAKTNFGVSCTNEMAVTFNLITNDSYIYLDDGKSEIMVDDKPLNSRIDLQAGSSQLNITDVLTGVKTEGAHTGSSVLVMMPY